MFISEKTVNENIGYSEISQEKANLQAQKMENNGCYKCYNCNDCNDCEGCYKCHDCNNCYKCYDCNDCEGCYNCYNCNDCYKCHDCDSCYKCYDCYDCYNCNDCNNCNNCYKCYDCYNCKIQPILAGFPNNWICYGRLIEEKLQIVCGCRKKSYSEAKEYWTGKENKQEVLAAVEYIATIARLRSWKVD